MINNIVQPTSELLQELLNQEQGPCISLYMSTHLKYPENQQDVIQYKHLVHDLTESLAKKYSNKDAEQYIKPLELLINDTSLWNNTRDGLAIFVANNFIKIVSLNAPVDNLVIVSERFHTKPLREYLQSLLRYQVLSINLDDFQLYEGNRYTLSEIELNAEIPKTINEALGKDLTEKHSTVASYGGTGVQSSTMHHGDGGKKDQLEIDTEKFFRIVSSAIDKYYSKPSGLPLLLAALPEHHHLFHEVSKNPLLQKDGIMRNAKAISNEKLAELAWEILEPNYLNKIKEITNLFEQAKAKNNGSDNPEVIAKAINEGRVQTLILEQNRILPGKTIDASSGNIKSNDLTNSETGDLLDEIAVMAIRKGTEVIIIAQKEMPTRTGMAAIFRY